jgi:hypothetical protein
MVPVLLNRQWLLARDGASAFKPCQFLEMVLSLDDNIPARYRSENSDETYEIVLKHLLIMGCYHGYWQEGTK